MSDVAIIMGSDSDWPTMESAAKVLDEFGITYTAEVISAHRMPDEMSEFAKTPQNLVTKLLSQELVVRHTYPEWSLL